MPPTSSSPSPGWCSCILGLALTMSLVGGPRRIGGLGLNLHWMLLGLTLATLGYSAIQLGVLARALYGFDPSYLARTSRLLTYNRGMLVAAALTLIGAILNAMLVVIWLRSGLRLTEVPTRRSSASCS